MNLENAVMDVPWFDALQQYRAYRELVREGLPDGVAVDANTKGPRATTDDVVLYRTLRQLTRGKKVIDLSAAMAFAGVDAHGRPKLAVGRADRPFVHVWTHEGRYCFTSQPQPWSWASRSMYMGRKSSVTVRIPGTANQRFGDTYFSQVTGRAQTPMVPAHLRPRHQLRNYYILWEAVWHAAPPVDPVLIQRVDGNFWVVLCAWDLTILEQAVLRQKL